MSLLKTDSIEGLTTSDVLVNSNLNVGIDADPYNLDISGNAQIDGILNVDTRVESPGLCAGGDIGIISSSLVLTNVHVDTTAGGTVVMRDSTGAGTLNQAGFLKMYLEDGTTIYVPYFTSHAGA